jgi:flagellar biosynthesis protein
MAGEEIERAKRRAVALRYDADQDRAPKMIAKGRGHLADRIVELAKEHGIHVHHDPDLVALLAKLDVQSDIPEDLYQAIAEILAFVYRLNNRMKG